MAEEGKLQEKIFHDLDSYGEALEYFKIVTSNKNGTPDAFFTTTLTGGVLLELKAKGKELRIIQETMRIKLNKCGCKAFKADSWIEWVTVKNMLGMTRTTVREHYNRTHGVI